MNANAQRAASRQALPAEDAWGPIDPRQATVPAALQTSRADQATPVEPAPPATAPAASTCSYCAETLLPGERMCPRCLRTAAAPPPPQAHVHPEPAAAPPADELSSDVPAAGRVNGGLATYALEAPVRCPQCDSEIRTFRVVRVLRTQVSFTSTLPRKGYVIVCPECERLLSAELSGLI